MSSIKTTHDVLTSERQFVTARVAGKLFGLPIEAVHEVFAPEGITRVPLSPPEIEGVLNLRGRIVTMIDVRQMLGFESTDVDTRMAIGLEDRNETFGLIVDEVGEVFALDTSAAEPTPTNLDKRWADVVKGVHRLPGELLLLLDVKRVLGGIATAEAA
ncbi:chemotaxis protein CheW [Amorphus orientalis]|uniref:Purine-binding chemotaxis protein CheW n=1 Tax=Amorphus orientalis TaxID=649198 RepID=A0AAE3VSP9_9HYPH|nr:chemotaxis protein CheW [Amorphus orientalis]MDQ0317657.1 purine-binding chemotaxis protein CheW [Amorphus orientalis]